MTPELTLLALGVGGLMWAGAGGPAFGGVFEQDSFGWVRTSTRNGEIQTVRKCDVDVITMPATLRICGTVIRHRPLHAITARCSGSTGTSRRSPGDMRGAFTTCSLGRRTQAATLLTRYPWRKLVRWLRKSALNSGSICQASDSPTRSPRGS